MRDDLVAMLQDRQPGDVAAGRQIAQVRDAGFAVRVNNRDEIGCHKATIAVAKFEFGFQCASVDPRLEKSRLPRPGDLPPVHGRPLEVAELALIEIEALHHAIFDPRRHEGRLGGRGLVRADRSDQEKEREVMHFVDSEARRVGALRLARKGRGTDRLSGHGAG